MLWLRKVLSIELVPCRQIMCANSISGRIGSLGYKTSSASKIKWKTLLEVLRKDFDFALQMPTKDDQKNLCVHRS